MTVSGLVLGSEQLTGTLGGAMGDPVPPRNSLPPPDPVTGRKKVNCVGSQEATN